MSFNPHGGGIANANDVALNNPAANQNLTYNGRLGKWVNQYAPVTSVTDYGAKGDGVKDDAAAIQAAIDDMQEGGCLFFPPGKYMVGSTIILPKVNYAQLVGTGVPGMSGLPTASIVAAPNANLFAIAATEEWFYNLTGAGHKDAIGISIFGLGFDGGGQAIDGVVETTANTQYGLVVHGIEFMVERCYINSTNSHGLVVAGITGADGSTSISESHEGRIQMCGIHHTGGDGFHAMPGAQDGYFSRSKVQDCGGHCIFTDNACAAWTFLENHPTLSGKDIFHCLSGWEYDISHNYIGRFGYDGVGVPGRPAGSNRYFIYVYTGTGGAAHIADNHMHTHKPDGSGMSDPVVGLCLKGWVNAHDNTCMSDPNDSSVTMIQDDGTTAWSVVRDNVAHS